MGIDKYVFFILIFTFCNPSIKSKDYTKKVYAMNVVGIKKIQTSDIINIKLHQGISFDWDNRTSQIVEDKQYFKIRTNFNKNKQQLADQIMDVSPTSATACKLTRNLYIGDLSFLLINKIKKLPNVIIIGVQLDAFEYGCPYPLGYFEAINNNRTSITKRVKDYLKNGKLNNG
jgi:hypothetical protein